MSSRAASHRPQYLQSFKASFCRYDGAQRTKDWQAGGADGAICAPASSDMYRFARSVWDHVARHFATIGHEFRQNRPELVYVSVGHERHKLHWEKRLLHDALNRAEGGAGCWVLGAVRGGGRGGETPALRSSFDVTRGVVRVESVRDCRDGNVRVEPVRFCTRPPLPGRK
ncbi:hypothetical protein BD413DRAFT_571331 [Trametes elegans]|nr:hypothetical protein BD413DRAFT_571331 [Trametes elegans]